MARLLDARAGRLWFLLQAVAGAAWWILVLVQQPVRTATLGGLDPIPVAIADLPLFVVASSIAAAGVRWAAWTATLWTGLVAAGMIVYATVTTQAGWGALAMTAASAGCVGALVLLSHDGVPAHWLIRGPFAFRPAADAATGVHVRRTVLQLTVFWGGFLLVLPAAIRFFEVRWQLAIGFPVWVRIGGGILLVAASALGVWSALAMSTRGEGTPLPAQTAKRLVVAGPYRLVRNPMAVAGIAQGVAVGLIAESWLIVVYALCGSVVWNTLIRPLEEADLEARFGDGFRRYRAQVRCWMPRMRPPRQALSEGRR